MIKIEVMTQFLWTFWGLDWGYLDGIQKLSKFGLVLDIKATKI